MTKGALMGARHKLNQIYILIAMATSATIGLMFESWLAFFGTLAAMISLNLHSGDIRPNSGGRR
jgi:hypothetical protein